MPEPAKKKAKKGAEAATSGAAAPSKKRARSTNADDELAAVGAAAVAVPPKKKKAATTPVVEVTPAADGETKRPSSKGKGKAAAGGRAAAASAASPSTALSPAGGEEASPPGRLDRAQVARAVRALLTHVQRDGARGLLDGDAPIHVLFGTKQMPKPTGKATKDKPVPMALPHPFVSLDKADICLITKDPQREFKDKLAEVGVSARVIGVSKLKKKFHPFEAKRELCASYQLFLADARVLPMLPPLLGKTFFQKKRLPTAVDLTKKDLRAELERAACGTLYRHATGTSNSFQVGTAEQPEKHIVGNILAAVEQAVSLVPGKWANVQSLQLRTTNSVALPFYNSLPHA